MATLVYIVFMALVAFIVWAYTREIDRLRKALREIRETAHGRNIPKVERTPGNLLAKVIMRVGQALGEPEERWFD